MRAHSATREVNTARLTGISLTRVPISSIHMFAVGTPNILPPLPKPLMTVDPSTTGSAILERQRQV